MKKLICVLLLVVISFSLASCEYEYSISETIRISNSKAPIIAWCAAPYDKAIDLYFNQYPTDDTVIYIPKSGSYTTITGKKFTAEVGDIVQIRFLEDTYYSRLLFDIKVFDESGELIIEKKNFCSYVQVDTKLPDLTYVSEEFCEYWLAMTVRSDKLKK